MPLFSIVIPTYNRVDQLKQVIAGFERQSWTLSDFEVVIVSDGSTDGTDSYLEQLDSPLNLVAKRQENSGPAAARNLGVEIATGQIIIFVDDDVVPSAELIAEHAKSHDELGQDCVVLGPMLSPTNFRMAPWVHWEQLMLYKQYDDMEAGRWEPTARQFYTGNASVRRQHILDAGSFDTTFLRAEDVELAYRLADKGIKFAFNSEAIGYHYVDRKFSSWLKTPYMYGRNDVIFTNSKGQSWLIPTVMREFHGRHAAIKVLAKVCLSQPLFSKAAVTMLKHTADVSNRLTSYLPALASVPRFAYSGIYNLTYYQGVADELGGRKRFFELAALAA